MSPRRLLPLLAAFVVLAPVATPRTASAAKQSKRKPTKAAAPPQLPGYDWQAEADAYRLLHKTERVTEHPEKATQPQLAQAARDLARANELSPTFELQPWFHADVGTVLYSQAKATQGRARRRLLEKASVQFYLAALTHDLDADRGTAGTNPRDVIDYEAAGDATASFILYHVALVQYELGDPGGALVALNLLFAAAADHEKDLARPEYLRKARTLLPKVRKASEEERQRLRSSPQ